MDGSPKMSNVEITVFSNTRDDVVEIHTSNDYGAASGPQVIVKTLTPNEALDLADGIKAAAYEVIR